MTRLAEVAKLLRVSGLVRLVGMTMLAVMTCVMGVAKSLWWYWLQGW